MMEEFFNIFWPQTIMLTAVYILVLAMIFLDLWSGVRKAKQRKEYASSEGYKRTVKKIAQYYNTMFCVTAIDVIQMMALWQLNQQAGHRLPVIPLLTFACAIFIGLIEAKSIYEKAEDKERARAAEAATLLGKALKDRDTQQIVAAVVEYMKTDKEPAERQKSRPPVIDRRFHYDQHVYDEPENENQL